MAIVALLLFIFAIHYFFPSFYGSALSPAATALWSAENSSTGWLGDMLGLVRSKHSLVLENQALRREIASRDAGALLLAALQAENSSLKEALGRPDEGRDVLGVVLSRPPATMYDTLVLDVGTEQGVRPGDKVYADGSILIGDVAEAFRGSSKVSLFSTPGRSVPVLVGSSTAAVEAVGRGGGNLEARMPAELSVKVGDVIFLPQLRAHVFGVVEEVQVDSTDSIQTVLFKAPVNMHELRFVEVETRPGSEG